MRRRSRANSATRRDGPIIFRLKACGSSEPGPKAGLTPAVWAELQNSEKKTSAQRKEDQGTVYVEGILDQGSDGSADYSGRHPEPEGPELLPDNNPHANDDSKRKGGAGNLRPQLARSTGSGRAFLLLLRQPHGPDQQ